MGRGAGVIGNLLSGFFKGFKWEKGVCMCIDARASHTHICRSVEYVRVGKDGVSLMSKKVYGVFPLSLPRS